MSEEQCRDFLNLVPLLLSDHLTVLAGTWERLSQVAVMGALYNSSERHPHPKCLPDTRVDLLNLIHGLLDDRKKNQLIWLHGTVGVGKSAVAFTVAERMRGLKMTEETKVEKRLAGTFFFSRKHTKCCTTGYFFATLAYQLATHFPSIRQDVNRAIHNKLALLDPGAPLCDQMEALFLQPLRKLRLRLRGCPPLTFVIDALDECISEFELTELIVSLAQALRDSDLPVTHILLTSRSETHISKAFQNEEVRTLCEIPVKTSGEGVTTIISLDGFDVDNDIYTFLRHSFKELKSRHPDFPQPSEVDLTKLASRAGRRFIVASTMMKFIIHDKDKDPRDRLQLMLKLTSKLLPGTEVYKLYDCIISTCADPKLAYMHLSIVAALADPLPLSQISRLLGPGWGCDVEATLIQLRSVMDIPTDSTLPVNIYHSSIRDYVSDPSNCSLPQIRQHNMPSPHSLLAESSFRLMIANIPETTALLDALSELEKQSQATQPEDPHRLKFSLSFLVRPPESLSVLICMLWLRGDRSSDLQSWLGTLDGRAWLQTQGGEDWLLKTQGEEWLQTRCGQEWLQTQGEQAWVQIPDQQTSVQTHGERPWLQTARGRDWLQTARGRAWLQNTHGTAWLQNQGGRNWLQTQGGQAWLQTQGGKDWLQTQGGQDWLQTPGVQDWLQTPAGREWLQAMCGKDWLQTQGGIHWLQTQGGQDWLQTQGGQDWLQTQGGQDWLQTPGIQAWLQTQGGRDWLQTMSGKNWLRTQGVRNWLQTQGGKDWLQTQGGRNWLQTSHGQAWESTPAASVWVTMEEFSRTVEAISKHIITSELHSLPAFKVIQQLKSLPDFLMLPIFLALRPQSDSIYASPSLEDFSPPDKDVVHAMNAFLIFANEARERSRSASVALKYACQNWAMHMSRAPNSRDDMLNRLFHTFLNHHLLSWLEMQWCLNSLESCFAVITEGQKLIKVCTILVCKQQQLMLPYV
jgi:environmental stress-induced protein Ves